MPFVFFLAVAACTGAVAVANEPPVVALAAVAEVRAGQAITLSATFTDDVTRPEDAVWTWAADPGGELDGVFTTTTDGATLTLEHGFDPGEYTVAVTAVDAGGIGGVDTIGFTVRDDKIPQINLHEPRWNAEYADTLTVFVRAEVSDRDDDVSSLTLAWGGAAEGADAPTTADAAGSVIFSLPLRAGNHTLTVRATDPLGATEDDSVTFSVLPGDVDGDGDTDEELGGNDCDDTDSDVHPGADESCDGADNDCDGDVDEGCAR